MKAIVAVWRASIVEIVRSRLYLTIVAAGALLVLSALAFSELSVGETLRTLVDIGLAFISLIGLVIALVLSITTVSREIETRSVIPLLSRNVERWQYLLGRYLGVCTAVVTVMTALSIVLAGIAFNYDGHVARIIGAGVFGAFEACLVAALAFSLAVRSSPVVSAMVATIIIVVGRLDAALQLLIDKGTFGASTPLITVVHHVLPQLSRFDLTAWAFDDAAPVSMLLTSAAYGVVYTTALFLLAA
ncbi:MAG TPA: hypothetical protein VGF99_17855, partial [Myxococcota bacterium]